MLPKLIFSDFDGTLTCGTELTPTFFQVVDLLQTKNIPLIIVTGRSVSWAHFLLTHFSALDYVIAEGGGVIVKRGVGQDLINEFLVSDEELKSLDVFSNTLLGNFNGLKLSADSIGRSSDRAIELGEFEDNLSFKKDVEAYMSKEDINYSTSSVHLNFWKGEISKYSAVISFLSKYIPDLGIDESLFFGDSLNDQSMFKEMKYSIGVSNITSCIEQMEYPPAVVLEGEENIGANGVYNYLLDCLK